MDFNFSYQNIFPSARQALAFVFSYLGLSRKNIIILPEWSSHCLISSVAKYCTPAPFCISGNQYDRIDAILFYEQWGWCFNKTIIDNILTKYENKIIIFDRVDSISFFFDKYCDNHTNNIVEIFSFSKVFGTSGGGLVRLDGKYLIFYENKDHEIFYTLILDKEINESNNNVLTNFYKSDVNFVNPDFKKWFHNNDVIDLLDTIYSNSKLSYSYLMGSHLSDCYLDWMKNLISSEKYPRIVPLFKNYDINNLKRILNDFRRQFNINVNIYHFNWSGNPMLPYYESCLAIPFINEFKINKNIIDYLENYLSD